VCEVSERDRPGRRDRFKKSDAEDISLGWARVVFAKHPVRVAGKPGFDLALQCLRMLLRSVELEAEPVQLVKVAVERT
jgi:hypothetical protein